MDAKHLWDVEHPYYAQEGNYYHAGEHTLFASWAAFMAEVGDADADMNLVYRFDWKHDTDDEKKRIGTSGDGTLLLYYMGQRKARCWSAEVRVTGADEPAVLSWLAVKWAKMQDLWAPFSVLRTPAEPSSS